MGARLPSRSRPTGAPVYPRILDELVPSALHTVEGHANNPVEADYGRLKAAAANARAEAPPLCVDNG